MRRQGRSLAALLILAMEVFWLCLDISDAAKLYGNGRAYSVQQYNESVMKQNGIDITMPRTDGGLVSVHAGDVQRGRILPAGRVLMRGCRYSTASAHLTYGTRTSSLYDSPAAINYSAFYGAYAVREHGGVFGF